MLELNRETIKRGIATYIEEQWVNFYHADCDITVDATSDTSYTAVCLLTVKGYDSDTTGTVVITFDNVIDISSEMEDDEDPWCSAIVDVKSCTVSEFNSLDTEDLYTYSEFTSELYKFIYRVYSDLPAKLTDGLDFYVRNY